ncbi:hypothetical protein ACT3QO_10665 [Psychrobacter sp. AOP7-D1-15]|uniref:hypothetical protein n=1 Tax=unclassified Psychrobacter TaxID=196806 RepID=UPI001D00E24F|nr:hypothetical protein [Psychrobacter sp. FME61]
MNTIKQPMSTHNTQPYALPTPLQQARNLVLPSKKNMLRRAPSVAAFWQQNSPLLEQAWVEWETTEQHLPMLDETLFDPSLRAAVAQAWQTPSTEMAVKDLWQEILPNVYQGQLFDPAQLHQLRGYLQAVSDTNIPIRPPYGIALNRNGAMLDARSQGYLAAPHFQAFYSNLMNRYMRPIARLLFANIYGYDTQTFGFSIQYQPTGDTALQLHTDASAVTMNINLNLIDEPFTGSEVDFVDRQLGQTKRAIFKPGMAIIHRGAVPHAAHPITSGQRTNMVLWLYGDNMQVPRGGAANTSINAQQRWSIPHSQPDSVSPF